MTVDSVPPEAPTIDGTSGATVTGTGEPGATVNLDLNDDGEFTETAVVQGDGTWSFVPETPLAEGTVVSATQTDPAGNESPEVETIVDQTDPPAPVISTSDNDTVAGTAEANAEIEITVGDTTYTTTADDSGNWSITPEAPDTFVDNEQISATAADAAGNTSDTTAGVIGSDADGDLIADSVDTDDDNDGISDAEEDAVEVTAADFVVSGSGQDTTDDGDLADNEFLLTPDAASQVGAINSNFLIDFTQDFELDLQIFAGTNDGNGADGLAVFFHRDPDGDQARGIEGGGLGAAGTRKWYRDRIRYISKRRRSCGRPC